jgi:hypothetical protein
VAHEYEVERFSVDEQARLQLLLGEPLFEAIAKAVSTLAPVIQEGGVRKAMEGGTLSEMAKALSGANWGEAAGVLTPLPKMILDQGGPRLVAQILSKTTRLVPVDALRDKPMPSLTDSDASRDLRQNLGDENDRNQAYGDGNMGEYWKAAAMVLLANFTPTGPTGFVDWKQSLQSMTGGILQL